MQNTRYKDSSRFIHALLHEGVIQTHALRARNGKIVTLYSSLALEEFTAYEVAMAIFPQGYFCNTTAIYHHGLTNQIPAAVYICHETIQARGSGAVDTPSEARIRSAFISHHRHTKFIIPFQDHEIVVLDRERGSGHGVTDVTRSSSPCPVGSRVAGLERALIDAVVAPQYNGGLTSLSSYFSAARKKVDTSMLLKIYGQLKFVYPYAQVIGFFLDNAGMHDEAGKVRAAYPPQQRFYVDHGAKTSWAYDDRWMVYYPKGLVDEN